VAALAAALLAAPALIALYLALAPGNHGASHARASRSTPAVTGAVPRATAPMSDPLTPVSPAAFNAPVAAYLTYADHQLGLMESRISQLERALASGDRSGAQKAWRGAFADYLTLGAVYLEGQIEGLNQAIDGTAGGLRAGTASRHFTGLHRLELGLWTGAALRSLEPWGRLLAADVSKLRRTLPHVRISPLDYATRAHEILEDAVRDLLSGTDVPWSGEGVLGTDAAVIATSHVVKTLAPLLNTSESVLGVDSALTALRSTIASIRSEHGGLLPTNSHLTQRQSERLDASVGMALEGLAQIPGALETAIPTRTPPIPRGALRADP